MRTYFGKLMILFLTFLSLDSIAQHTVSGIISDKTDKAKLLEGVSVFIPEFNLFDVSREGGTYILRHVGIGIMHIQFSMIGYKTVVKTVDTKDSATVIPIEMEPSLIDLQEVAVTGNNSKLPDAIPYPLLSYSSHDLKRTGAINFMSALSQKPGIDKISLGNGISKPVIRGLSFNRILLYQYGTRIDNQPWDDRHDLGINENGVDRIELIKGPAALMYGADAMGGALVFIDEKPPVTGSMAGDLDLGFYTNTVGLTSEAGIKGSTKKGLFYSARAGIQSHTSYVQGLGDSVVKNTEELNFAANSKFMSANGKAVLGMIRDWGVSKLTYAYFRQQIGIIEIENDSTKPTGFEDTEQRDREMEAPYQDVTSQVMSLENTMILRFSKLNFNISYQNNNRKEFEKISATEKKTAIGLKLNTLTFDLKYTSNEEKKTGYTIGTQGIIQSNRNFGKEGLVPDADMNDFSIYALLRHDRAKWNFLGGGRFDARSLMIKSYTETEKTDTATPSIDITKNYQLANGSLGIAFHPLRDLTLKLNAASGFTAPNYAQLGTYGKHEGTYRFEEGNTNLKIEQNLEGDFGINWNHKSMEFRLEGYTNKIMNYIYIANTGNLKTVNLNGIDSLLPVYEYRQQDATIKGFECSVHLHPTGVEWLESDFSFSSVHGKFDKGGNIPYIPSHKFVAGLTLKKKKINYLDHPYAAVTFSHYLKQDEVAEFETTTGAYSLVDLHFGGDIKWAHQVVELSLSITNLFNTDYFNHLSLIRNIGIREMGRNVAIRIRVPFSIVSRK